jgi:hypothetical protein
MLYTETIAVFSQIHTKHINTVCGAERRIVESSSSSSSLGAVGDRSGSTAAHGLLDIP